MDDSGQPSLQERQQRLAGDLKALVRDAEALLRHAVREAGGGYEEARAKLQASVDDAKGDLADLEAEMLERARAGGRAADAFVRRHPWETAGIAAAVGAVIGLLLARRPRD